MHNKIIYLRVLSACYISELFKIKQIIESHLKFCDQKSTVLKRYSLSIKMDISDKLAKSDLDKYNKKSKKYYLRKEI